VPAASRSNSSAGKTRLTSPIASASSALTESSSSAIRMAVERPTSRGKFQVAPASGTSPTPLKASLKLAAELATRRSQARASDTPAPAAMPLTRATVGLGMSARSWTIGA
jgi:hypothetical protein